MITEFELVPNPFVMHLGCRTDEAVQQDFVFILGKPPATDRYAMKCLSRIGHIQESVLSKHLCSVSNTHHRVQRRLKGFDDIKPPSHGDRSAEFFKCEEHPVLFARLALAGLNVTNH